ncbi:DUF4270 family protein [Flavobacterium sp. MAH-1]|uniref:DUF4270 family protein n=1 Tax=Flavobacterium agri TaxID=2743471 RepID=A0A7Y8XZ24_9FLAO|nr:DUF4270 family protein [Flavobacterium agri]NUY79358.1 DUF4270 family protein [Flavobacterium agri]NYA69382.1 DUF4270 family protein [Flavobacterium agri]
MTHSLKLFALFILGALAVSCGETDVWLDSDNLTGSNLRLIEIDSFQIDMSTYKFDSIVNDSGNRLLVGRYEDPVFGKVRADAFMEVVPATYYIPEGAVFDSIVLNLSYDGYFYNDTLATQRVKVRRLTETITLSNGVDDYYNTVDFDASDDLLGEKTFRPRISKDSLTIRLSDALGQDLLDGIRSDEIVSSETLRDRFKGIKISPADDDNAAIMGYSATKSYIRLYYSDDDDSSDDESDYLDFKLNGVDEVKKYANRITSDRADTVFSSLVSQETELGSQATNDLTYLQGGIGITTKIMFPTIRSIKEINDNNGKIFKANLKLRINPNYYNDKLYSTDSLYVAMVDRNNDILGLLTDAAGNDVMAYIDKVNPEYNEVYVVAPVEQFLEKILDDPEFLHYGLVLMPKGYNSAVSRLIINGQAHNNYESKLELTYAIYD